MQLWMNSGEPLPVWRSGWETQIAPQLGQSVNLDLDDAVLLTTRFVWRHGYNCTGAEIQYSSKISDGFRADVQMSTVSVLGLRSVTWTAVGASQAVLLEAGRELERKRFRDRCFSSAQPCSCLRLWCQMHKSCIFSFVHTMTSLNGSGVLLLSSYIMHWTRWHQKPCKPETFHLLSVHCFENMKKTNTKTQLLQSRTSIRKVSKEQSSFALLVATINFKSFTISVLWEGCWVCWALFWWCSHLQGCRLLLRQTRRCWNKLSRQRKRLMWMMRCQPKLFHSHRNLKARQWEQAAFASQSWSVSTRSLCLCPIHVP